MHSFNGVDGSGPSGKLILDAEGNLYGTTDIGGDTNSKCFFLDGCGTVFKLSPGKDGKWKETVLHRFDLTDGASPNGDLVFDTAGNLYGTTYGGGPYCKESSGCGNVFQLTPEAKGKWKENVLHNFGDGKDGARPSGGLIFDSAGNLYGTTTEGGAYGQSCSNEPCGTVFRLARDTNGQWEEKVLHSFGGSPDGSIPFGSLTFDAAGSLYGAAGSGGSL